MLRMPLALLLVAGGAVAQEPPATGSVSGVVRDSTTGAPEENADIFITRGSFRREPTTNSQGRFSARDLPPGSYRVSAYGRTATGRPGPYATRQLTIHGGEDIAGFDLLLPTYGEISGKVIDENKEPIPNQWVVLVAREYSLGALRYVYSKISATNDLGEYTLDDVPPGRGYLVVSMLRPQKLDALSNIPVEPEFRRRVPIPTYYPGVTSREGAQTFILRPGERRVGIDIQVARANSYCISGSIQTGLGAGVARFNIENRQVTSGASGYGAVYALSPSATTGPDGKFRICELYPGRFELSAFQGVSPALWASSDITITDRDLSNVVVASLPKVSVPGEVVWAGKPPQPPLNASLSIYARPLTRTGSSTVKAPVPGAFTFDGMFQDEFSLQISGLPDDCYIKDIVYGLDSILHKPFRPSSAMTGSGLRIILARDGGKAEVRVTDKDDKPAGDVPVAALPVGASSEADLADRMVSGKTDQDGVWSSPQLAPGKYYVVATREEINPTPESIGRLWSNRLHDEQIEIGGSGNVRVELKVE